MREPVRDIPRIGHMIEAITNACEYVDMFETKDAFLSNKAMLHATIYNVQIIGEAVYKLTPEFKQLHPEIPWKQIDKRNVKTNSSNLVFN